nr:phage tail protein [Virgibacillus halotolerans]
MTAISAFTKIFEGMPFGFVLSDVFDAVEWEGFGAGESRLETFKRALDRYKAEFRIVGNTVYIERQIGRDTSFVYRYKLNASNIVKEIDANEYWTYAKGYGNYGNEGEGDGESSDWQDAKLIREYTSPLAKILGIRHAPPIKDGRISTASRMDSGLKALVDESLKISITTDIHDLRRQGYALAQPELGDRVFVIDERIGLDEEVRVIDVSVTKDWRGNVVDMKLTIGSESLTKRHQSNMSTAVDRINELVEGRRKLPFSVLDDAVRNATRALQNAQTELSFGINGILAVDKRNPNLLTLLNSAGIGISNDGGNTFRTAMTGDGIVADVITAGILNADQVAIQGGSGRNFIYMSGDHFEAHGTYTRTWWGQTKEHEVGIQMRNGYLLAENYNEDKRLYYSDHGISTFIRGYDDESSNQEYSGSGVIEFFSHMYDSTVRGMSLFSNRGTIGIRTNYRDIILDADKDVDIRTGRGVINLRPTETGRVGNNVFQFYVKDHTSPSDTDGVIRYGSPSSGFGSGVRFKKSASGRSTVYATDGDGTPNAGDFSAGYMNATYDISARNLIGDLQTRSTNLYLMTSGGEGEVRVTNLNGNNNGSPSFRDFRARHIRGNSIRVNDSGANFYIGTSTGEVRITTNEMGGGDAVSYRPIKAYRFLLPNGNEAIASGTFSLLSLRPTENEGTELVREIDLLRTTNEGRPAYRINGLDVAVDDVVASLVKSNQELTNRIELLEDK